MKSEYLFSTKVRVTLTRVEQALIRKCAIRHYDAATRALCDKADSHKGTLNGFLQQQKMTFGYNGCTADFRTIDTCRKALEQAGREFRDSPKKLAAAMVLDKKLHNILLGINKLNEALGHIAGAISGLD